MKYKIRNIVTLHEKGKRNYNEDFLFPSPKDIQLDTRMFMVCDGVGGNAKGDKASQLVCQHFSTFMQQRASGFEDKMLLTKALHFTEKKMTVYASQHLECEGMATTLTYLHFTDLGIFGAWAGDSRIYQIRNGEIIYKTADHSLINTLIKHGEITEEEAKTHPKRNVILRAISGTEAPTELSVFHTDDISAGDYFLLCTDGILEATSDKDLQKLLVAGADLEDVKNTINTLCQQNSNDNYTMILLKIEHVAIEDLTVEKTFQPIVKSQKTAIKIKKNQKPRSFSKLVGGLAILLIGWFSWQTITSFSNEPILALSATTGGVMLSSKSGNILIDPILTMASNPEKANSLFNGNKPYRNIEWLLLTNFEDDASWLVVLEKYMDKHKDVKIITTAPIADKLKPKPFHHRIITKNQKDILPFSFKFILDDRSINSPAIVFIELHESRILYGGNARCNPIFITITYTESKIKNPDLLILHPALASTLCRISGNNIFESTNVHLLPEASSNKSEQINCFKRTIILDK